MSTIPVMKSELGTYGVCPSGVRQHLSFQFRLTLWTPVRARGTALNNSNVVTAQIKRHAVSSVLWEASYHRGGIDDVNCSSEWKAVPAKWEQQDLVEGRHRERLHSM